LRTLWGRTGAQLVLQSFNEHFLSDCWNILDLTVVTVVPAVLLQIIIYQLEGWATAYGVCVVDNSPSGQETCKGFGPVCPVGCTFRSLPVERSHDIICQGAISCLFLILKTLFFLRPFKATGPLVKMIVKMIWDIRWFLFMEFLFCYAVFVAFFILYKDAVFPGQAFPLQPAYFFDHLARIANLAIGDFDNFVGLKDASYPYATSSDEQLHLRLQHTLDDAMDTNTTKAIFGFSTFMITLVTGNLFVAIMTNTYTSISENATNEFSLERAATLVELENMMTNQQLSNKEWFPNYLHVLVPRTVFEGLASIEEWMGTSMNLREEVQRMAGGQNELRAAVELQGEHISALTCGYNAMQMDVTELARLIREIHAQTVPVDKEPADNIANTSLTPDA